MIYGTQLPSRSWRAVEYLLNCSWESGWDGLGDHILKKDLKRHGVSAALVSKKELAVTGVDTVFKGNMVIIIVTVKGHIKLVE